MELIIDDSAFPVVKRLFEILGLGFERRWVEGRMKLVLVALPPPPTKEELTDILTAPVEPSLSVPPVSDSSTEYRFRYLSDNVWVGEMIDEEEWDYTEEEFYRRTRRPEFVEEWPYKNCEHTWSFDICSKCWAPNPDYKGESLPAGDPFNTPPPSNLGRCS